MPQSARVATASGLPPKPAIVTGETAWRTITRRDPYSNILRATIAVAAAGLGGADAITVLPHTAALGLPDAFARRVARNIQLILLDESNLARVTDPAAGSGALESLTEQLCLDDDQLEELNRLAGRCEEVYGPARDIEWAFADGRLYLLQCRAITRAGSEERSFSGAPVEVLRHRGRIVVLSELGDLDEAHHHHP